MKIILWKKHMIHLRKNHKKNQLKPYFKRHDGL